MLHTVLRLGSNPLVISGAQITAFDERPKNGRTVPIDTKQLRKSMKPLEGVTVLEFSTMITASFAAMMMAEQGARVILDPSVGWFMSNLVSLCLDTECNCWLGDLDNRTFIDNGFLLS